MSLNPKQYSELANELVINDEPLLALKLLECLPAEWRDETPKEIVEMRSKIRSKIMMASDYAVYRVEKLQDNEQLQCSMNMGRAQVIENVVKQYNDKDIVPHIHDVGPGDLWLPMGLRLKGHKFGYSCVTVNTALLELSRVEIEMPKENRPIIFVACEIVEHLVDTSELMNHYAKLGTTAKLVVISTPKYCYDRREDWQEDGKMLEHVRTYTPSEFSRWCADNFKEHKFDFFMDRGILAVGQLR